MPKGLEFAPWASFLLSNFLKRNHLTLAFLRWVARILGGGCLRCFREVATFPLHLSAYHWWCAYAYMSPERIRR